VLSLGGFAFKRTVFILPYPPRGGVFVATVSLAPARPAALAPGYSVSWTASPANQSCSFSDSESAVRAQCPPGEAAENAPRTHGSFIQRVAWVRRFRGKSGRAADVSGTAESGTQRRFATVQNFGSYREDSGHFRWLGRRSIRPE
jgi:hypothetical protein